MIGVKTLMKLKEIKINPFLIHLGHVHMHAYVRYGSYDRLSPVERGPGPTITDLL